MTTTPTPLQQQLATTFPQVAWQFEKPLAPLTYFKVGGPAEAYVEVEDTTVLSSILQYCRSQNIHFTILGGASNVIISDEGVRGIVLRYTNQTITDQQQTSPNGPDDHDTPHYLVQAASGIKMPLLVSQTVQMGYTGLEFFLGVPGTLGGAVYNNSHYLTQLIGSHIQRVQVLDDHGQLVWIPQAECEFGYDSSRFHNSKEVIVTVEFHLAKGDAQESQQKIIQATQYRAQTQPLGLPSSGCIFQNVPNTDRLKTLFPQFAQKPFVPGGFIIDQAGLKGTQMGGVSVSTKHAAWFINNGSATAADVRALVHAVKAKVKERFDIDLHEEVFYLQ